MVDFTASWCGPCRFIALILAEIAKKTSKAIFLKVDMDVWEVLVFVKTNVFYQVVPCVGVYFDSPFTVSFDFKGAYST